MAVPSSRESFKQYCLRALGKPVINIEVDDDQLEDRIDFALQTFYDWHMEGSDRTFYKYQITPNNHSTAIHSLTIVSGGTGYSNGDALTFTGNGRDSTGSVNTNSNGVITSVTFTNGAGWGNAPTVGVTTSGGSGASITAELGGFIPIPENIIAITNIFDVGISASASNLFNLKYQIVLNDLYMFNNLNIVPYYSAMQNVAMIQEVLVGKQPLRFNRYLNRLYIDMDWSMVVVGTFIVVEAYKVFDPETFSEVWADRWLQKYTICQFKMQWGNHLKKYGQVQMIGGTVFNGQVIYDEAVAEEAELMYELQNTYSLPAAFFMG
jgi:hypothetical protein